MRGAMSILKDFFAKRWGGISKDSPRLTEKARAGG